MFKKMVDKAKASSQIAKNVDWQHYKNLAKDRYASASLVAAKSIEDHWPKVEKVLVDGLLTIAADKLRDEHFLEEIFEKSYEFLPTSARLIIPRDTYITYCFKRKEPLLIKVEKLSKDRQLLNEVEDGEIIEGFLEDEATQKRISFEDRS